MCLLSFPGCTFQGIVNLSGSQGEVYAERWAFLRPDTGVSKVKTVPKMLLAFFSDGAKAMWVKLWCFNKNQNSGSKLLVLYFHHYLQYKQYQIHLMFFLMRPVDINMTFFGIYNETH